MAAKAKSKSDPEVAKLSYSEAQQQLERALAQLQSEEMPLEELPKLYAKALALESQCRARLEQVAQDIQRLDPDNLSLSPLQEETA